jgi:hypothetical protein
MRPGAFENGFGFGEPELDANSALTELDKGKRFLKNRKLGFFCFFKHDALVIF